MSYPTYGARDGLALIRATHIGDLDVINEIGHAVAGRNLSALSAESLASPPSTPKLLRTICESKSLT